MISLIERRWPYLALALFLAAVAVLFAMGRPPICTCGDVALWGPVGPKQSQMLVDWYSFSHIIHGFLFYAALHLVAPRTPVGGRLLIAIVIASPLAWWAMNRWLQDFAYRIEVEWWVFALAGTLAVGIALLTVSFQSIKAALMNPVNSLRSE